MAKTPPPAVTLDPSSPVYQTPDGAADAVSRDFAKQPNNEQAAVIIKRPDGTYGYSTVTAQGGDSFSLRAQLPQGHTLAGIVHSHPGADALGQVFSPDDLDVADTLKVPSFIRFNNTNAIRRYTPGASKVTSTSAHGSPFGLRSAIGDQLAQEPATVPSTPPPTAQAAPSDGTVRRDDSITQY